LERLGREASYALDHDDRGLAWIYVDSPLVERSTNPEVQS
jgi:hypothetical protein